ncbi:hypothetical protein [Halorussus aquaticus]|uniref:Uncharacterized protein n=1 Tax=Halorussus aquaticus TaxID=2953748 RepID=A0ABD5Q4Y9_9EURY|nr:hypothetical protein [Halorussus aquaticus]
MSFDALRSTDRGRWLRAALTVALFGLAAAVAFTQGGVLPASLGVVLGLFASVALYRYLARSRGE